MKQIVLFPGSFNPVHHGHLAVAGYLALLPGIDEVRMIISPHNPLKGEADVPPEERLKGVREAVSILPAAIASKITLSDIEFSLPEPRYTWNTLQALRIAEPQNRFILAIGGDNILILEKWHRRLDILATTEIWVYPRPGYSDAERRVMELSDTTLPSGVKPAIRFLSDAPQNDISSTQIRHRQRQTL